MNSVKPFLSKSKYLVGLQCSKLLWYHYNAKEKIPSPDEATKAIFEQGHEVGELAKSLFPGGIEVAKGILDFAEVIPRSIEALKSRKPLFEAAFRYKNAFARVDILDPTGRDHWDIIEVKSSTEVKDVHIHDLALQRYTYEGAGLNIRHCYLMYVDNTYVRRGRIEPTKLFTREDVTKQVADFLPRVETHLKQMIEVIGLRKHPAIDIGPHCNDPYDCPLHEVCWSFLPDDNVFTMHRLGQRAFDLLKSGVERIAEIPDSYKLSRTQTIQLRAVKNQRAVIDKAALADFLGELKYPLYFLDFETLATAIPLFDEVRPYEQIPFQFSLHIVKSEGAKPEHHSFLADGLTDPRPEFLTRLKRLLGVTGSIVSYNASFERGRMKSACEIFPQYMPWWERTEPRIVDLLKPFRAFDYYHPDQSGSASMKDVLPALTGAGYERLSIADGGTASREYLRVTFAPVQSEEREKIREQLEKYCALDTGGMVDIVNALTNLVQSKRS